MHRQHPCYGTACPILCSCLSTSSVFLDHSGTKVACLQALLEVHETSSSSKRFGFKSLFRKGTLGAYPTGTREMQGCEEQYPRRREYCVCAQNIRMDLRAGSSPRLRNGQPAQRQTHGQAVGRILGEAYFGPEFFFPNAVLAFLELYV